MNAHEYLHISEIKVTPEETILEMPITDEVKQPYGIVHGGINALLAEAAASLGANSNLDNSKEVPVGIDVNTHHIAAATKGTLRATATPIHAGRRVQTWQVETRIIETDKLTSSSTVTLLITPVKG
jgi:uncharacterized protein (TIGR00369 family)